MTLNVLISPKKTPERFCTQVFFVWALSVGVAALALAGSLSLGAAHMDADILLRLRVPRVLAAFGVGGLLALAGVLLQALLRNPLAEPYMLGAASGAGFFVLCGMVVGASWWQLQGLALVGSLCVLLLMTALLKRLRHAHGDVTVLLLLGVLLGAVLNAGVSVIMLTLPDRVMRGAMFWLMGDLAGAGQQFWAIFGVFLCTILALPLAQPMNALMRGAHMAHGFGIDVARLRWQLLLLAGLATALAVAEAGAIGFVGLVVPHAVKLCVARLPRLGARSVLVLCVLWGAILLVCADMVARTIAYPIELPVGVFTTLLGAPFFAWQLVRRLRGRV